MDKLVNGILNMLIVMNLDVGTILIQLLVQIMDVVGVEVVVLKNIVLILDIKMSHFVQIILPDLVVIGMILGVRKVVVLV